MQNLAVFFLLTIFLSSCGEYGGRYTDINNIDPLSTVQASPGDNKQEATPTPKRGTLKRERRETPRPTEKVTLI